MLSSNLNETFQADCDSFISRLGDAMPPTVKPTRKKAQRWKKVATLRKQQCKRERWHLQNIAMVRQSLAWPTQIQQFFFVLLVHSSRLAGLSNLQSPLRQIQFVIETGPDESIVGAKLRPLRHAVCTLNMALRGGLKSGHVCHCRAKTALTDCILLRNTYAMVKWSGIKFPQRLRLNPDWKGWRGFSDRYYPFGFRIK